MDQNEETNSVKQNQVEQLQENSKSVSKIVWKYLVCYVFTSCAIGL